MSAGTETYREEIKPLLRPRQVASLKGEVARLGAQLKSEPYLQRAIGDRGAMSKQLRRLKQQIEEEVPRPYEGEDLDKAIRRQTDLEDNIKSGMPTQAEMSRRAPGSVNKHRLWDQRTKLDQLEWKQIQVRRHATGALDGIPPDSDEIANIESLRPREASHEEDLSVTQITRPTWQFPDKITPVAVMSPEQEALLKAAAPDVLAQMALLDNETRSAILDKVDAALAEAVPASVDRARKKAKVKREAPAWRLEAKALRINTYAKSKAWTLAEIAKAKGQEG